MTSKDAIIFLNSFAYVIALCMAAVVGLDVAEPAIAMMFVANLITAAVAYKQIVTSNNMLIAKSVVVLITAYFIVSPIAWVCLLVPFIYLYRANDLKKIMA